MVKIIHKYILKEFFESFFFGLLVFSIILLLDQIFQLVDLIISKGVPVATVGKLFALMIPNILTLTVPMAVLLAILLAYGRLSEDNEVTAMRSSGFGYFSFTGPVLVTVLAMSVMLVYFNMNLTPVSNREFRRTFKEVMTQRPLLKFEDNSISSIGEYKIFVKEVDKGSDRLLGVNIYKFAPEQNGAALRITASSAVVTADPQSVVFTLYNGYWQKPDPNNQSDFIYLQFQRYQFVIRMAASMIPFSQSTQEMSGAELLKEMENYRQKKLPTTGLEVQYWLRWTLAFSPILMALMGIPLGIVLERGGKSVGFGVSMLVLFGYYVLLVTGMNLGEKGYFAPGVIAWLPNAASLLVGALLWKRMVKR